jgi:hypothetical protein
MLGENSYSCLVVKLMRINLIHTLTHGDYSGCQVTRMLLPQGNLSRWILLEVVTQELKTRTLYTWMFINIFYDAFLRAHSYLHSYLPKQLSNTCLNNKHCNNNIML